MNKKRSVGVTVLGWLFIIGGILGLCLQANFKFYFAEAGRNLFSFIRYFLGLIISLASVAGGIFVLKLKAWARQLVIVICLLNIVSLVIGTFVFKADSAKIKMREEALFKQQEQLILQQYKPEYQKKALQQLETSREANKRLLPIFFMVVIGIAIAWNLLIIYFFMRPQVEGQFVRPDIQ